MFDNPDHPAPGKSGRAFREAARDAHRRVSARDNHLYVPRHGSPRPALHVNDVLRRPRYVGQRGFRRPAVRLAEDFQQFPALAALTKHSPHAGAAITKAALLLARRAKGQYRKFNEEEPAHIHSLRVAEAALEAVSGVIEDPGFLVRMAVKAILHDVIEDFDTSKKDIRTIFAGGSALAQSIERMTTPSTADTAVLFPFITGKYIANDDMRAMPAKAYLEKLKKNDRNRYERLKAELKFYSKTQKASTFLLDEAIVKAVDNADSLISYAKDIEEGRIRLIASDNLGPPTKADGHSNLTTGEVTRNAGDRWRYHQSVMAQIHRLAEQEPDAYDYKAIISRLDRHFAESRRTLLNLVEHRPEPPRKPHLGQPVAA